MPLFRDRKNQGHLLPNLPVSHTWPYTHTHMFINIYTSFYIYKIYIHIYTLDFPGGTDSKVAAYWMRDTQVQSLDCEGLEKEMVTHSSILAWKIPWLEKPHRLQSMVLQRVRHDSETSLSLFILFLASLVAQLVKNPPAMHESPVQFWVEKFPWRRDRLPTPVFLGFPGDSDSKESACSVGDLASIPVLRRSLGGGHGNLLQYSCLENPHGQRRLMGYSAWGHRTQPRK